MQSSLPLSYVVLFSQLAGFKLHVVETTGARHAQTMAMQLDLASCPDGTFFNLEAVYFVQTVTTARSHLGLGVAEIVCLATEGIIFCEMNFRLIILARYKS